MMSDTIFKFVVESVRAEEKEKRRIKDEADDKKKAIYPSGFWIEKKAGELVKPCQKKAKHHRERQFYYEAEFAKAEKKLKKKGISIQLENNGDYLGCITSGAIPTSATFTPKVDQVLMSDVKQKRAKVKEHKDKADQFEKYARAFVCDKNKLIKLDIEMITYFELGE